MHATLLWASKSDPGPQAPIRDNVVQVVSRERTKRRFYFEEGFSMRRLRTTRLQVIDQSVADLITHGQAQWRVRFRLPDLYCRIPPMNLIQLQSANVSNTHSQPACQ